MKAIVRYKTININEITLFYREAGEKTKPCILLLHGFPTSSHMFRNLIPLIAEDYYVIAPDLPGFGFSSQPSLTDFQYNFNNLTHVIELFSEAIGLNKFALYVFDYGAPIGFRMALRNPEKITGIISQNGNAYEDGLSDGWNPIKQYWSNPTPENREVLKQFTHLKQTLWQYETGVLDKTLIAPETYTLDQYFLDRPGNQEIQLELLKDYENNVKLYPEFQKYFKSYNPKLLAVWGENDPYFLQEGAKAFERDNSNAKVKFYKTGHFALETHLKEISEEILLFMKDVN